MSTTTVPLNIVSLSPFSRIRVTGRDRAKFLHNFCTHDVKSLSNGKVRETFFTDMKARVLAHGCILAGDNHHELWMLPGDEPTILKHLNKYVITEDVVFQSISDVSSTLVAFSPVADPDICPEMSDSIALLSATIGIELPQDENCWSGDDDPQTSVPAVALRICWASYPLLLISLPSEQFSTVWQNLLTAGFAAVDRSAFDRLRILERFPVFGIDITNEHLAPEADRNAAAISYTKGCYLGQEPIARLDAMGHINRALRTLRVEATTADLTSAQVHHIQSGVIGRISSCAVDADGSSIVALAMIKVHGIDLTSGLTVTDSQQHSYPAQAVL